MFYFNQPKFFKRILLLFFILTLVAGMANSVDSTLAADSNWTAKYWNNKNLSGNVVLERQEKNINYDWGSGSPHELIAPGNFSARWTRTINFPAGTHRFTATIDDGMRVWVDDALIIDSWVDSQARTVVVNKYLNGGDHKVKVEYYEAEGQAVAKLQIDPSSTEVDGWRGEYFNNTTLSGSPAVIRTDPRLEFNWGTGSPAGGIGQDNFSVRWTRSLNLDRGRYRFTTTTDDGVRLWVNGRLLIDKWFDQAATTYSGEIDLPGGPVDIRMEYYDQVGGAVARLDRTLVSGADSGGSWRGEYFNNKNVSGSPTLVRNDANIAFNWGEGSPHSSINSDNFSVRWTRTMDLSPGRYRFTANTDDGVRLWVNGQRIINAWDDHRSQDFVGEITLPGGLVDIKMEYYENAGGARANLSRTLISVLPTPTPQPSHPTATVPGLRLNLRQGPGVFYSIIDVLAQGDVLRLLGRNEASTYVQVISPNNQQGWVYAPLIQTSVPIGNLPLADGTVSDPQVGPTATVSNAVNALYVRSGPGSTFDPITSIVRGQQVRLIGRNQAGTWIKIQLADGRQGWSSTNYLVSSGGFSGLPVTSS